MNINDSIPTNTAGDAEEVLKHLILNHGRMPGCIDLEHSSIMVLTDDGGEPKAIGGISFGDGSRLVAISFEMSAKMAMGQAESNIE